MNEQVLKLIEKQKESLKKEKQEAKEKHLIALGLVKDVANSEGERKYVDEKEVHAGNVSQYSWDRKVEKYYLKGVSVVPIDVTDEEYEEICRYFPPQQKLTNKKHTITPIGIGLLGIIGIIIFAISTIAASSITHEDGFVAFAVFCSGGITCAFMVTLSRMLEVLKGIKKCLENW